MANPNTLTSVGGGATSGAAAGSMLGPWGALAGAVVGGAFGAYGASKTADAQSQAYQYQAGIAQMNAQIGKQNADYERHVGEVQAQQEGMKTAQVIGDTKAKQAGSGIDVNSGTSAAVRDTQHEIGQYDQATIRSNAARRAYGYEVEAASATASGNLASFSASNARTAGNIGIASSLISAGGSVASKWMQYGSTWGKET